MLPTVDWKDDAVVMIDQRKLPNVEVYVTCKTAAEVARAIKTMVIRGAPAIGVSAAMGVALGMKKSKATGTARFAAEFQKTCDLLASTRPTAVNLFWAIDRMKRCFAPPPQAGVGGRHQQRLEAESRAVTTKTSRPVARWDDWRTWCRTRHGSSRCNAARWPRGYGTALGIVRGAIEQGKRLSVYADETRPFLQGARLTAWELLHDGIDTTVITDNMAATFMRQGMIDLVVVGADRIAANGDVANKVGTYGVAVLAKEHGIPFYVAAPSSTVDLATSSGAGIPIEERPDREVTHVGTTRLTPRAQ
jgi:methylthioribose-1-phosphate isomerase